MMILERRGNLLAAEAEALVNTVNTVGVMGKGIALQFKQAFPDNFKAYHAACKRGEVQMGRMFVFDRGTLGTQRLIINFPTKKHWRTPSRLADIEAGLDDLVRVLNENSVTSIAVPALGCGNGGLPWAVVRPLIIRKLEQVDGLTLFLFPPAGAPPAEEMLVRTSAPRMTLGRALLIALTARYHRRLEIIQAAPSPPGASLLEMQKLMYLLQESGEPLRLRYEKGRYGPYAENLNKVLQATEGHFTRGYGDRSDAVLRLAPVVLLPGAEERAAEHLTREPDALSRIDSVLDLIDGFESPYGLELLATVHFAATHIGAGREAVVATVQAWNERKKNLFQPAHIEAAWIQLERHGRLVLESEP